MSADSVNKRPDIMPASMPAQVNLSTDPHAADLNEPFAFEIEPGAWAVVQWTLTPKLATNGQWFPAYWAGPGSKTWVGTDGGIPERAARFVSIEQASQALAGEAAP